MTGNERLLRAAQLLWGPCWQSAMAEELRISRRTLSRYAHGKTVPEFLLLELDAAMVLRIGKMSAALGSPAILLWGDRVYTFTADGEPIKPEGDLLIQLRSALEAARDHMKGPADAE